MRELDWVDFKILLDKKLSFMHVELSNSYEVFCSVRQASFHCQLPKNGGADVTAYEANYKHLALADDADKVAPTVRADKYSLSTRSFWLTAQPLTTTSADREIAPIAPATGIAMKSGLFFADGGTVGDTISSSIIDKNNVLGMGGTPQNPTIVAVYVPEWRVMPGVVNALENYSIKEMPVSGLFVRMNYTNVGLVPVKVICNLICYEFT